MAKEAIVAVGRPILPEGERREVLLQFRVTPSEADRIFREAREAQFRSVSDYLRLKLVSSGG